MYIKSILQDIEKYNQLNDIMVSINQRIIEKSKEIDVKELENKTYEQILCLYEFIKHSIDKELNDGIIIVLERKRNQ